MRHRSKPFNQAKIKNGLYITLRKKKIVFKGPSANVATEPSLGLMRMRDGLNSVTRLFKHKFKRGHEFDRAPAFLFFSWQINKAFLLTGLKSIFCNHLNPLACLQSAEWQIYEE